jgi:hypothetical protein
MLPGTSRGGSPSTRKVITHRATLGRTGTKIQTRKVPCRTHPPATRHTPHATRHTPHATRHTPHATRHTPHATRHTSPGIRTSQKRHAHPHDPDDAGEARRGHGIDACCGKRSQCSQRHRRNGGVRCGKTHRFIDSENVGRVCGVASREPELTHGRHWSRVLREAGGRRASQSPAGHSMPDPSKPMHHRPRHGSTAVAVQNMPPADRVEEVLGTLPNSGHPYLPKGTR